MKYIKTYESWREIKPWLKLPQFIIQILFDNLMKFIPKLNIKYDELSAKIDFGKSLTSYTLREDLEKITINDIQNKELKNTLKFSNFFNNWNIYYKSDNNGNKFYITKDELKKDDKYYADRLSSKFFDKTDKNAYILVALHTKEHNKMKIERDTKWEKQKSKALEKAVSYAIKNDKFIRSKSFDGEWNNDPILFKVVRANRIDLFNKIVKTFADAKENLKRLVSMKIDENGWQIRAAYSTREGKSLFDECKSEEMRKSMMLVLYTQEELDEMEFQKDIKNFNL